MIPVRYFSILGFVLLPLGAAAQNSYNWWDARKPAPVTRPPRPKAPGPGPKRPETTTTVIRTDSLPLTTGKYTYVEQVPTFPGGQEALVRFLQKNVKRPPGPKQHGRVFVQFTVLTSGDVADVRVAPGRGINDAYDTAAVELVHRFPRFEPGKKDGKPVATALTIPVDFR